MKNNNDTTSKIESKQEFRKLEQKFAQEDLAEFEKRLQESKKMAGDDKALQSII